MLAETVIIGYGSAKKRDLTGSITNIKGSEIANKPATNPLSSLQGKIAGVQIVNSGQAGADPEIRIRGTNSINGYKPLYVVDGLFNDNINFRIRKTSSRWEEFKRPFLTGHIRCAWCQRCNYRNHQTCQRGTDAGQHQHLFRLEKRSRQNQNGECTPV